MGRIAKAIVAVLLAVTACSSVDESESIGPDGTRGSDTAVLVDDGDPTAQLCVRWAEFAALIDSDAEPTDELIDEVLEDQRGIEEVLPGELSAAWSDIAGWNMAFVEWFAAAGYQEITEDAMVAAFGDRQAADEAADAMEAGFATMREWSDRNCATGEGDAQAFCTAWTDISALLVQLDEEAPTAERIDELFASYDEAGAAVPAEIRDRWDALLAFAVPFRDALVTVEYEPDRISDEILTQAFGGTAAVETLERGADDARVAIDAWSVEGCGDFCSRWSETREAIDQLGANHHLGWVRDMGDEGPAQYEQMQARIELATQLVPDDLTADWAMLDAAISDWSAWWEAFDFDQGRMESAEADARMRELADGAPYFENLAVQRHVEHPDDRDDFLIHLWSGDQPLRDFWNDVVPWGIASTRDRIDGWVDATCASTGGRPGQVRVQAPAIEGAAGSTLVLGVAPLGSTVEDLANPAALVAGLCWEVSSDPWGFWIEHDEEGREIRSYMETEGFRSERWADSLCDYRWEEGPAQLEAGPYTLLVAVVPGGVSGRWIAAEPSACLALDVQVDGETLVPLPDLPACEASLSELIVDPDPWRTSAPVDPTTPDAGSLRMIAPALVLPDDFEADGGELVAVLVPAGTTLNEVGRRQVWPSGGVRVWLASADDPHGRELRALGPVALPIMAVPSTGQFGGLDPNWLAEAPVEQLPLTLLAPGDYDLLVQAIGHSPESEEHRCGDTTVTIASDTVVDMPELGECP